MDYEKKYKEAFEKARKINNGETTGALGETVCEYIFPELKKSEDERIRKEIIQLTYKVYTYTDFLTCDKQEEMLAWLENQKEQKPQSIPTEGEFPYTDTADTLNGEIANIWNKLSCDGKFSATKEGFQEVIYHFINYVLKDRGLEYKDGQIVEIEYHCTGIGTSKEEEGVLKEMIDKPFEIKAGQWYMCIEDYELQTENYMPFKRGNVYKSEYDNNLIDSDGHVWPFGDAKDYFRPATEEEIPHTLTDEERVKTILDYLDNREEETPHEPTFKDDDWVVCEHKNIIGKPVQYKELKSQAYKTFLSNLGLTGIKPNIRLWNIQDAKEGDVLTTTHENGHGQIIFIFKRIVDDEMLCHCLYDSDASEKFCFDPCVNSDYMGNVNGAEEEFYPATQEQRNLLFQKMKEAGYEWDAEKKELRKIQKPDLDNTNGTS